MKILILSQYPWNKENSFGNTYSSIFGKIEDIEIANVYLMAGKPDYEPVIKRYYNIPESTVLSSFIKRDKKHAVGREVHLADFAAENESSPIKQNKAWYERVLALGKRKHWRWMFWLRELAWKYGNINYDGLIEFIKDFNPDIFFLPYSHIFYTNRLAIYIKDRMNVPMVMEMAMDHYTLKRISYNPLFWIDRFAKRRMIRKLASRSEMIYVISKKLKDELEHLLGVPCRVLYKTPDTDREAVPYMGSGNSVKFLFTGNIYANRWKSLAMLAEVLKKKGYGKLDIYTASPITSAIKKSLDIDGYSELHPPVSQDEVIRLQNEADVLVHVEAFDRYNKSLVRCAISTKIMDYLSVGRCILAIGPDDISSIEYLSKNDVALIANSEKELENVIVRMQQNPSVIAEYAQRGKDYTNTHLNAGQIRKAFCDELQGIIKQYENK